MSEKKLTVKEKAKLYENWLKFVDGKGYTEIFAEPQKTKEKFDKLNKEITQHKENRKIFEEIIKHEKQMIKNLEKMDSNNQRIIGKFVEKLEKIEALTESESTEYEFLIERIKEILDTSNQR